MSAFVSKEVLVDYAAKELDRSRKNKPFVRSEVINLALKFVELITFDNAPTPQAGIDEDGNVEIEYLVDGHDLNLTVFSEDLALLIYASDAKGKIAFEYTRQLSEELSAAELENIKGYLQKLSKNIRHRLYVGSSEVKDLEQNA